MAGPNHSAELTDLHRRLAGALSRARLGQFAHGRSLGRATRARMDGHVMVTMAMMSAEPNRTRPRRPGLRAAVLADAHCTAAFRGERREFDSALDAAVQILRLMAVTDAFLGLALYRVRVALQARRVPILPRVAKRLAIAVAGIYIGDRVVVHPGVYVVHGQVVIDGEVEIYPGVVISPAVTLAGLGGRGPTIGPGVSLGTGSRVLGDITVGAGARVGANAVVVTDVRAGGTAVGVDTAVG